MTEPADAVLAYWSAHRQQIPRSESQRVVLTNYIPVIVATVSGFLLQRLTQTHHTAAVDPRHSHVRVRRGHGR